MMNSLVLKRYAYKSQPIFTNGDIGKGGSDEGTNTLHTMYR